MKTDLEKLFWTVAPVSSLCLFLGCHSSQPARGSAFSELPPQPAKLAPSEVPPDRWSPAIRALKPIKVFVDVSNLVVVQGLANGVESGKYIIEPISSYTPQWHFIRFTPMVVKGFSPLTQVYDYQRSQP
jgi:hypothetical protein